MFKKSVTILSIALSLNLFFTSCDDDSDPDKTPVVSTTSDFSDYVITGSITKNSVVPFVKGKTYLLKGFVYVKSGVTLKIEPGVVIRGDKGTKATLFIEPGGKIEAEGTASNPIVFTSSQPKGQRKAGDWGGVVILGKAPVNKAKIVVEGENATEFGGTDAVDNSGILKYVRIEFAGIAFETDKEINGLTLGAVGSGTTIDYVQVSYGGDDSFEWFGGTVNAKHLISYRSLDDDFDTDNGYSGNVQYAVVFRDPSIADQSSGSNSNGFESDNDGASTDAKPKTTCKFANVTMVMGAGKPDPKFNSQYRIRKNSELSVFNSVSTGEWTAGGLELEGDNAKNNFINGKNDFKGLAVQHAQKPIVSGDTTRLSDPSRKNMFIKNPNDLGLPANYNTLTGKPSLIPVNGSALLTGGVDLPTGFESTSYIGAFYTTDWTDGWANWDPQNTDY